MNTKRAVVRLVVIANIEFDGDTEEGFDEALGQANWNSFSLEEHEILEEEELC